MYSKKIVKHLNDEEELEENVFVIYNLTLCQQGELGPKLLMVSALK